MNFHLNITQDIGHGMTVIFICCVVIIVAVLLDLNTVLSAARKNKENCVIKNFPQMIRKILNVLGTIKADKLLHFIAGMLITALVAVIASCFAHFAIIATVASGLIKEAYDEWSYGGWDWYDILATVLGGAVMQVLIFLSLM